MSEDARPCEICGLPLETETDDHWSSHPINVCVELQKAEIERMTALLEMAAKRHGELTAERDEARELYYAYVDYGPLPPWEKSDD